MGIDPYVYPGTEVLRNNFDVRDRAELERREAAVSALRIAGLHHRPLPGDYDLDHLKATHLHIFGDIYPWAGEIRTVAISKPGATFALPDHIAPYLGGVLDELAAEGSLREMGRDRFVERMTHYYAEINAAHPFREGNGRTQRAFLGQLAGEAGWPIAWAHLDADENIEASRASLRGDNEALHKMLDRLTATS